MQSGRFNIVLGAQAGSEAKGKLSAYLCRHDPPDLIVMAASPNAGHTAYIEGKKRVTYHLPVGALASGLGSKVLLGPTSVIRVETLLKEMEEVELDPRRLVIHPRAALITDEHLTEEGAVRLTDIGSTVQGVGACRKGKLMRGKGVVLASYDPRLDRYMGDTVSMVNKALDRGAKVLCEMTQGFDLDLEHGIHPRYCTSKMINPAMAMAEAGVSPSRVGEIIGVLRPFPIRVNNRTGTSGPYADGDEITWEEVQAACGCPHELQELTTTTKLPRRVFTFSWERFNHFLTVARPTALCLQFANYLDWGCYQMSGKDTELQLPGGVMSFVRVLEDEGGTPVRWIGTGPYEEDMVERQAGIVSLGQ